MTTSNCTGVVFNFINPIYFTQAAEKYLRAAVYMKDAKDYNNHVLRRIASATENTRLENLADQIESLLTGSAALRYPNRWCYPDIPHDMYDENKAEEAIRIADNISQEARKIFENE